MTLYELWGWSWHGYTRLGEESNAANRDSYTITLDYGKAYQEFDMEEIQWQQKI